MKFTFKHKVKTDDEILPNQYIIVKKFNNEILFIGILLGLVLTIIISQLLDLLINNINFHFYSKLYFLLILIPLHEGVHLLFFPSKKNIEIGIDIKRFLFYVSTTNEISKKRFLFISIAPFIFITIFPLILSFYYYNINLVYFLLYNTLASGIDLITFSIILKLPNNINLKLYNDAIYYRKN